MLVAIDPNQDDQPALRRAVYVHQRIGGKIKAFLPIYDFSYEMTTLLSPDERTAMRQGVISQRTAWIREQAKYYLEAGVPIDIKVVWHNRPFEAIIQEIVAGGHDLLLKMAHQHDKLESVIFTPTDWHLLRKCPCPVWMVKDQPWPEGGKAVVAVNLASEEDYHNSLNEKLVKETLQLADQVNHTEVHLVGAYPVTPINIAIELPEFDPSVYNDAIRGQHLLAMKAARQAANLKARRLGHVQNPWCFRQSLPVTAAPRRGNSHRQVGGSAIEQDVLADDEASMLAAQEGAGGAKFGRGAIAAGRDRGHPLRPRRIDADTLRLCQALIQRRRPVGVMQARLQVVDRHTMARHLPRRAGDIARQARARRGRQAQNSDRCPHRRRRDVDHPSPTARDHARQGGGHQRHRRQHVGVQRADEIVARPVGPETGRRPAGIGHENVQVARGRQNLRLPGLRRDVGSDFDHLDAIAVTDRLCRQSQGFGATGVQHQIHAGLGQCLGTAAPQPLARAANQRPFAPDRRRPWQSPIASWS